MRRRIAPDRAQGVFYARQPARPQAHDPARPRLHALFVLSAPRPHCPILPLSHLWYQCARYSRFAWESASGSNGHEGRLPYPASRSHGWLKKDSRGLQRPNRRVAPNGQEGGCLRWRKRSFPACPHGGSANFSAQYLHRQKSRDFLVIFQMVRQIQRFGAGDGNRTRTASLEG